MKEGFRSANESHDSHADNEVLPDAPRRNPFEVMRDWLTYREESKSVERKDKDKDEEKGKKGKISRAFRSLFKRNVEKAEVGGDSSAKQDGAEGRSGGFLRGMVAFEDEAPSSPPEAEDAGHGAEAEQDQPDFVLSRPRFEAGGEAVQAEVDSGAETSGPEGAKEAPGADSEEAGPEEVSAELNEEDNEEEPDDPLTHTAKPGAVPPVSAASAHSGGGGNVPPTNGNNTGNVPPVPPPGTPGGPPTVTGGGNAAPAQNPNVVHTHTERERVVEKRTSNGAALAAFVGAEYLSRRRDHQQKERIKSLEDRQKKQKREQEEREARYEQEKRERTKQKEARQENHTAYEKRRVEEPVARTEKTKKPIEQRSPQKAEAVAARPKAESRPQSVAEVLGQKEPPVPMPEIDRSERKDRKHEAAELETSEDIIARVEQMMEQEGSARSHEVLDETRHEIKDESSAGTDDISSLLGSRAQSQVGPAGQDDASYTPRITRQTDGSLGAPPQPPKDDDLQPGTLLTIWAALIIGIMVAIGLIIAG